MAYDLISYKVIVDRFIKQYIHEYREVEELDNVQGRVDVKPTVL
jgi:hypothetical protein